MAYPGVLVLYRKWTAIGFLVAAVLAASLAWWRYSPRGGERAVDRGAALAGGAVVVYRTTYLLCGSREEREEPAPPYLVGRTRQELESLHPGWEVVSFAPDRVVLERQVEAMCPDMVRYRYVTLSDGRVAVYYGREPGHLLLKELSPLRAEALLPEDRRALGEGVVLEGDEQVAQFLEGLGD